MFVSALSLVRRTVLSVGLVLSMFMGASLQAAVLHVGAGQTYTDIASAITDANDGDVIEIDAGTYVLSAMLNVTKAITLKGAGTDKTFIDGNWNGVKKDGTGVRCLTLNNAYAKVCDLTIQRAYSSSTSTTLLGIGLCIDANGGTAENCVIKDCCRGVRQAAAVGVYMNSKDAVLTNCVVSGNECYYTGCNPGDICYGMGVWLKKGLVSGCVIENNRSELQYARGAGIYLETADAFVTRTVIRGNSLSYTHNTYLDRGNTHGAGVYMVNGTLENCLIVANTLNRKNNHLGITGGGVYQAGGTVVNCTIVENEGVYGGGAYVAGGTFKNNILFDNLALTGSATPDYVIDASANASHICFPAYAAATGIGTQVPNCVFANGIDKPYEADYSIAASSPCYDKGLSGLTTSATDVFGATRVQGTTIDIGASEATPSAEVTVEFTVGAESALNTETVTLTGSAYGPGIVEEDCVFVWTDDQDKELGRGKVIEATFDVGTRSITLTVTCGEVVKSTTKPDCITVLDGHIYLSHAGSQTPPYNTPALAFTNIADAMTYARSGMKLTVDEGIYTNTASVSVDKKLMIVGAGTDKTIFEPTYNKGSYRYSFGNLFALNHADAVLSGVCVRNGTGSVLGTGVSVGANGGTVTNCWIVDNKNTGGNAGYGVGVSMTGPGRVTHCLIARNEQNNAAGHAGAGAYLTAGRIDNCLVLSNTCPSTATGFSGGGVYADGSAEVVNCAIADNFGYRAGGLCLAGSATAVNTIVYGNTCSSAEATPDVNDEATNGCTYCCFPSSLSQTDFAKCAGTVFSSVTPYDASGRLDPASVCVDAGSDAANVASADFFGAARVQGGAIDIGASEATPSAEMLVSYTATKTAAVGGATVTFTASVKGGGVREADCTFAWTIGGQQAVGKSVELTFGVGRHDLSLTVTPPEGEAKTINETAALVVYPTVVRVEVNATPAWPYDTAANAFTNLADAVETVVAGVEIRLGVGTYDCNRPIAVDKALTIVGAGRGRTILATPKKITGSLVTMDAAQATLSSLTIDQANCTVGALTFVAGGGGTVDDCAVNGCSGSYAVYVNGANSRLSRSYVCDNACIGVKVAGGGLVENCLIAGNTAAYGAGVQMSEGNAGAGTVRNCTIVGNVSTSVKSDQYGAGVYAIGSAARTIVNCIIWGNTSAAEVEGTPVGYPDAQGGASAQFINCCAGSEIGENCVFGRDPKLRPNGMLKSGSPCFRAGVYQAWMDDATDFFGNPRIDARARDKGKPCVDIGCHQSTAAGLLLLVK